MLPDAERRRFDELFAGWRAANFKRATGGLYALAGFDYQARVALAELAPGLVAGGTELEKTGAGFVEGLSDVTSAWQDTLLCLQVKRTLTPDTLLKASEEAVAIDAYLRAKDAALAAQARYAVVAQFGDPVPWSQVTGRKDAHAALLQLEAAGQLLPPRIEPDPWWRFLSTIYRHLDDPFEFARFALERVLSRRDKPGDAVAVRDDISERFARMRAHQTLPGRVFVPADFEHAGAPPARLAVGQLVTPERLRDGHYLARPERVKDLLQTAENLANLPTVDGASRLRVLWLQGRSGSGKSVLLVQLLEALVREGRRTVWLGGDAGGLDGLLRQVSGVPSAERPEFVLIDDLFDLEARDELDLAKLGRFIEEHSGSAWPVMVTCGPPEFADAFKTAARYRGFDLRLHDVAPVGSVEAERLAGWYRSISGKTEKRGPAFVQAVHGDGLFVSMAVELAYADLKQFAAHFVDRLTANGLTEALRVPLALARLYLWSPERWFPSDVRERLARLEATGDVSFAAPSPSRRYVRLTHPHLAAAIYDVLLAGEAPRARANDLVHAFSSALDAGDFHLVRRLLRVLANGTRGGLIAERLRNVDLDRVVRECARLWRGARDGGRLPWLNVPDSRADAATSWARIAATHPGVEAELGARPLDEALEVLELAESNWPALWSLLFRDCADEKARMLDWARSRVRRPALQKHPQWSLVWEKCAPPEDQSADWVAAGQEWLARPGAPPDWHFVWHPLFERPQTRTWALEAGHQRLTVAAENPEWAFVWGDLLRAADRNSSMANELLELGWYWLSGREERAEWTHVWRALLERCGELPEELKVTAGRLLELGWNWLPGREERAEWAFVWGDLLRAADRNSSMANELLELGWNWLPGREERAEWKFVWEALLERSRELPEELGVTAGRLLELGWKWLPDREERAEWSHVWRALLERSGAIPEELGVTAGRLLELGWKWLPGREERAEWKHVWEALLERSGELPEELGVTAGRLLGLGWNWLPGREERAEWARVWEVLLERCGEIPAEVEVTAGRLLELGWKWLPGREERAEWAYVWRALLERSGELPEELGVTAGRLLELGWNWLPGREERAEWAYVWEGTLHQLVSLPATTFPSLGEALTLGLEWLARHGEQPNAPVVWSRLVRQSAHLSGEKLAWLMAWGQSWLAEPAHREHLSFGWVVEGLLDVGGLSAEACRPADAWLLATRHGSGPIVAAKRIAARPGDRAASRLAGRLLNGLKKGVRPSPKFTSALAVLRSQECPPKVAELVDFVFGSGSAVPTAPKAKAPRPTPSGDPPALNSRVIATVNGHQQYGVFLTLAGGWTGLMHQSVLANPANLEARFPKGASIAVRVTKHGPKGLSVEPEEEPA